MGWWSDVLADAIQRSGKLEIVSCFTRSEEKRQAFAAKYRCRPVASYETMLADPQDRGDHQHHAERRASGDHVRRRRQARVPRQTDRHTISDGRAPGDNPDVASLILEHNDGALSTVNASYASASEGKRRFDGLRHPCPQPLERPSLTAWFAPAEVRHAASEPAASPPL
jgi:hypothetical protein